MLNTDARPVLSCAPARLAQDHTVARDAVFWREFEKTGVTHSAAHYLMAIHHLRKEFGYARGTDVAQRLDVSRGAVSIAVSQLKKHDFVTEDPHRFLLLTEKGGEVAKRIEQNFSILSKFMEEVLGVSTEVAHADACKMEHLLSPETVGRLLWLTHAVLDDPQRDEIIRTAMASFSSCEDETDRVPKENS